MLNINLDFLQRTNSFTPKPKATQKSPVIGVWKNMTVLELSQVTERSINDVLDAIWYTDSSKYTKHSVIENRNVLYDAVKRLGVKYKIVPKPTESTEELAIVKR